jgi:hypothetical protein
MRGHGFSFCLLVLCGGITVVSAQSTRFEADRERLHQEAAKARAAIGVDVFDPILDRQYPYSQIQKVKVQKLTPGAGATVTLAGKFPPGVTVLSDRDGAVLSGAVLTSSSYSARMTIGATEHPGYVKLWAFTPVNHVWSTMPVVFIDGVYRFDLRSANGFTVKVSPMAKSFTVDDKNAALEYKAEFFKPGETTPFQTRAGSMNYVAEEDTRTRLDINLPEPDGSAAKELDEITRKMNDPKLTGAQRSELTLQMVKAQQRMLEETMKANPADAQKKIDDFGCRIMQVYPGQAGAVEADFSCGKNFNGGALRTTGTMTAVK